MTEEMVLIGAGGHCKSCIDIIEQLGQYHILGILDITDKIGMRILDYEIIGTDNDIEKYATQHKKFLISIGQIQTSEIRKRIFARIKEAGGEMPIIISPFAIVSRYTRIGEGTIIGHNAVINAGSTIGVNCIINTAALIEHDAIIGDHCHISTSAVINGGVQIGSGSFVGSNASIKEYVKIGHGCIISFQSKISQPVADRQVVR